MASLIMIEGPQTGREWELESGETVIGRQQDCQIVLNDGAVSRTHARILGEEGAYILEDLRSRNSTYLNEQRLVRKTELKDGDCVKICDAVFQFRMSRVPEARLPEVALPTATGFKPVSRPPMDMSISMPDIVSTPHHKDYRIPPVVNGPDAIDQAAILSSFSLTTGGFVRLLANPEAKLKALMDLSTSLGQMLTIDKLLPKLLDSLMRAFPLADRAILLLNDLEKNQLSIRAIRLRDDESTNSPPISTTIIKYALRRKEVVLSDDVLADERFSASDSISNLRIRQVICAPMFSASSQLLGVIQLDAANVQGRFIQDDLELLVCLSNQAALAIDNANLHKQALAQRELERDLEFAHTVQIGFLPNERPQLKGFRFYDYYEPAQHVGGDFFDYVKLPDGRLAVSLGDVAGKGIPAALLMARLFSMIRYSVLTMPNAADAVKDLNTSIAASGLGNRFITFLLCVIDPAVGKVSIVNAGHMSPIIHGKRGTKAAVETEASGLPLGVSTEWEYQQTDILLEPEDSMFMFTDGLTEAMNPRSEMYSSKRILDFLSKQQGSVEHLAEALVADVEKFCEKRPQRDDICLVCFRMVEESAGSSAVAIKPK